MRWRVEKSSGERWIYSRIDLQHTCKLKEEKTTSLKSLQCQDFSWTHAKSAFGSYAVVHILPNHWNNPTLLKCRMRKNANEILVISQVVSGVSEDLRTSQNVLRYHLSVNFIKNSSEMKWSELPSTYFYCNNKPSFIFLQTHSLPHLYCPEENVMGQRSPLQFKRVQRCVLRSITLVSYVSPKIV